MTVFYKYIGGLLCLLLILIGAKAQGIVEVSGTITQDTTWTSDDIVLVTGSVFVAADLSLTIEPGAEVRFSPNTGLSVFGDLTAVGGQETRIRFTSSADTAGGSPAAGSWQGVVTGGPGEGVICQADFLYAQTPVTVAGGNATISGCRIENFSSRGVYLDGYTATPYYEVLIDHCQILQTAPNLRGLATGVRVYRNAHLIMTNSEVRQCGEAFSFLGASTGSPTFEITDCNIRDNSLRGITLLRGG